MDFALSEPSPGANDPSQPGSVRLPFPRFRLQASDCQSLSRMNPSWVLRAHIQTYTTSWIRTVDHHYLRQAVSWTQPGVPVSELVRLTLPQSTSRGTYDLDIVFWSPIPWIHGIVTSNAEKAVRLVHSRLTVRSHSPAASPSLHPGTFPRSRGVLVFDHLDYAPVTFHNFVAWNHRISSHCDHVCVVRIWMHHNHLGSRKLQTPKWWQPTKRPCLYWIVANENSVEVRGIVSRAS